MGSSDLVRCRHRRGLRGCCIMRGDLALDLSDIGEGAVPSQLQFRRDQAVLRIGSVILPEGAVGSVADSFKIAAEGTLDLVAAAGCLRLSFGSRSHRPRLHDTPTRFPARIVDAKPTERHATRVDILQQSPPAGQPRAGGIWYRI